MMLSCRVASIAPNQTDSLNRYISGNNNKLIEAMIRVSATVLFSQDINNLGWTVSAGSTINMGVPVLRVSGSPGSTY